VGDTIGKYTTGVQEWTEAENVGGEQPQGKTNRQSSGGNKARVGHNTPPQSQAVSNRLWGIGSEYKGHFRVQDIQAFTPEQIQIQKPEKTFAISVDTENYFVSNANLNVSNSASKTISILLYLIHLAQSDKTPTLTSVVSESVPHLKRGAMRDFKNIMVEQHYWNPKLWNATDSIYTFETGSTLEFFSADQPDKLRGARRDRLFINESNNIPLDAFDQLEVRTKEFAYLDYNPTNEFWVYDVMKERKDCEHTILTYKDNEALSQEIIDSIEQRKNRKGWWLVYGLGQLGEVEGKIYRD
jgi:hypothetical protein